MSLSLNHFGTIQRPISVFLTTTNKTDLLTGSFAVSRESRPKIGSISIVNADASARLVTLEWHDGTNDHVFFRRSIPANETVILDNVPILFLDNDWTLKATAAQANVITVTVILALNIGQSQ